MPNREDLLENITWLIGEVNSLGGEAIALQCAQVEGMADQQIEQLFRTLVDPEFEQIQIEAQGLLTTADTLAASGNVKEVSASLRKLRKRCEAVRERDFFPSGAAAKTLKALDAISERLRRPVITDHCRREGSGHLLRAWRFGQPVGAAAADGQRHQNAICGGRV